MSYHQSSSRSHHGSVFPRSSMAYPGSSIQDQHLDPNAYLPMHDMTAPMSSYSNSRLQNHSQQVPLTLPSSYYTKSQSEAPPSSLFDYNTGDYSTNTLQTRICDTCGFQYRSDRSTQAQGSASAFATSCDRCLSTFLACNTSYPISNYSPQTPSFSPPAQSPGLVPTPNYDRLESSVSPRSQSHYNPMEASHLSPPRAYNLPPAPSPNRVGSSRSNVSKSNTPSPSTSHSAASLTGKESYEAVTKRPHARGYITTLDARLSRLEAMLGELVPSAADQLKPGQSNPSNASANMNRSQHIRKHNDHITRGDAVFVPRRDSLAIPDDPILDGALEDALLASRPVHRESRLGLETLYSSKIGSSSNSIRQPLSRELSTMHLFVNK